jgi:hypothetical protein
MLPKYNTAPVPEEKIQKIQEMLNDPIVGEAWKQFVNLGGELHGTMTMNQINAREIAWNEYVRLRDDYLKLPPLSIPAMQGTHLRYRN